MYFLHIQLNQKAGTVFSYFPYHLMFCFLIYFFFITHNILDRMPEQREQAPSNCDLLLCEFINDYGLSNSSMIDYIIRKCTTTRIHK